MTAHKILHSEAEIRARTDAVAREIAHAAPKPDFAVAILAGAFVFAADLLRALAREGLSLPIEFLWLRSYAEKRTGGEIAVLVGPTERIHGKTVLLVDGVLDGGQPGVHVRRRGLGSLESHRFAGNGDLGVLVLGALPHHLKHVLQRRDAALGRAVCDCPGALGGAARLAAGACPSAAPLARWV